MDQRTALYRLGITDADLAGCQQALTLKLAAERLAELQAVARRGYHRIALDLHPDRTGGDEAKLRELQEISAVYDVVMSLRLAHLIPVPEMHVEFDGCCSVAWSTGVAC